MRLSWTLATSAGDPVVPTGYAPVTHRASDTALVAGRGDVLARDTDFGTAEGWREISGIPFMTTPDASYRLDNSQRVVLR